MPERLGATLCHPSIGLLLGNLDFTDLFVVLTQGSSPGPYLRLAAARDAGAVTLNYGVFVGRVVSFLIVAFGVFLLVKGMIRLGRKEEPKPEGAPKPRDRVVVPTQIRVGPRRR